MNIRHLFVILLLASTPLIVADSWLDFFTTWNELNARNRRALFGIKEEEPPKNTIPNNNQPNNNPLLPSQHISATMPKDLKVTLKDLKGCVPQAIYDLRDYLKDKDAFVRAGARPPRGILLVGSPGTGKTSIVRALAAEVGVPLIATSASKFVEIFVGTGPKFIRELFASAQAEMAACGAKQAIIFIDEIDCLGNRQDRNACSEDHKTLTELLTQMDGFTDTSAITIIAATNCVDRLDEALLRPGRFDEIITVELPDYKARLEILKLYLYGPQFKRATEGTIDLESIAQSTEGWSGAELESIMNKAAILVARARCTKIKQADLDEAFKQVKQMRENRR